MEEAQLSQEVMRKPPRRKGREVGSALICLLNLAAFSSTSTLAVINLIMGGWPGSYGEKRETLFGAFFAEKYSNEEEGVR